MSLRLLLPPAGLVLKMASSRWAITAPAFPLQIQVALSFPFSILRPCHVEVSVDVYAVGLAAWLKEMVQPGGLAFPKL